MLRSTKTREPVANLLLAALPGKEYQRLRPHLEEGVLSFGEVPYESRALQQMNLISYVRGQLRILDRAGLEARSCGCYEIVKLDVFAKADKRKLRLLAERCFEKAKRQR
jgi:hypothetical protein